MEAQLIEIESIQRIVPARLAQSSGLRTVARLSAPIWGQLRASYLIVRRAGRDARKKVCLCVP